MKHVMVSIILAAVCVWPRPAPAQTATCDEPALEELLTAPSLEAMSDAEKKCPLPHPMVRREAEAVLASRRVVTEEELRNELDRLAAQLASQYPRWGSSRAEAIASSARTPGDAVRPLGFATLKIFEADVDADVAPCGCAFVAGRASSGTDRACFRPRVQTTPPAAGSGAPPASACNEREILVVEYNSWEDIAPAVLLMRLAEWGLRKQDAAARKAALARLQQAEARWEALRKHGYIQYPWELFLSRAGRDVRAYQQCFADDQKCSGEEGLDPGRLRAIVLHPELGLAFSGFGTREGTSPSAKASYALMLEVAGVTYYTKSFKTYFGISAAGGFVDFDFSAPRLGPFVHITRYVHAGYLWGVAGNGKKDASIVAAFDVASWLGKWMNKNFAE